jgi:hypothetical protein
MLVISRAIDSRSRDCGNDDFLIFDQLVRSSSRKFRGGEIAPLDVVRRNYPGSAGCTNVSNFTLGRFPLKGLRE